MHCFDLAKIYHRGGIPKQPQKASFLISKAMKLKTKTCLEGDSKSCAVLGDWLYSGYDVPKDIPMAITFLERGCELNDWTSCIELGYLYKKTMSKEGIQRAQKIYQKLLSINQEKCTQNTAISCKKLGDMYHKGWGLEPSPKKARKYYLYSHNLFQKRCDNDSAKDCAHLANLYRYEKGVNKDIKKAEHYYQKSCDLGDDEQCFDLGLYYQYDHPQKEKSTLYYQKSFVLTQQKCHDKEETDKCRDLGYMFIRGVGTVLDIWKGETWYTAACRQDDSDACLALGKVYEHGIGEEKNPKKAQELFQKSCNGGIKVACEP